MLLIGALVAWALPALARPSVQGRETAARVHPAATVANGPAVSTTAAGGTAAGGTAAGGTAAGSTAAQITPAATVTGVARTPVTQPTVVNWVGTWNRPFAVLAPASADLIPPLVTVSGADGLAVGSGEDDEDAPAHAQAEVLTSGATDVFAAKLAPAATQETLAAGYLGSRLVLITGTSTGDEACCSTASTQVADAGDLGSAVPLASGLEGASTGVLVPVRGGLLAAVDNQAGITVARSDASGAFSGTEQLVGTDPTPPLMAAGPLRDGGALIAWTAPASAAQKVVGTTTSPGSSTTASGYDQPRNQLIEYATAGPSGVPGSARLAVTVPAGRQIDALVVLPHGAGVTLGWTESWYIGNRYESRVFRADVSGAGAGVVRAISPVTTAAVGLSGAGSSRGREVLAWQACDIGAGTCDVEAVLRPDGAAWGPVQTLGSVDPTSFPVATQSRRGQSLVGWISDGTVYGSAAAPGATAFYPPARVSAADDASGLTLSFGAGARAAAVWVQGTVDQKLVGARFTP